MHTIFETLCPRCIHRENCVVRALGPDAIRELRPAPLQIRARLSCEPGEEGFAPDLYGLRAEIAAVSCDSFEKEQPTLPETQLTTLYAGQEPEWEPVWCANDPCETEAIWVVHDYPGEATPLCATCLGAFEMGQGRTDDIHQTIEDFLYELPHTLPLEEWPTWAKQTENE